MLAPGSTLGIVGGGQLGRMMALAAYALGFRVHVFCQSAEEPLAQATPLRTLGAFDDVKAQEAFANAVDLVTLEFENLPVEALAHMASIAPLRPGAHVLARAQDRLAEKEGFAAFAPNHALGHMAIHSADDLAQAAARFGLPLVVKTRRDGYDGKGQWRAKTEADLEWVWQELEERPALAEPLVDLAYETSAIVARSPSGAARCFPCPENRHEQGILRQSCIPGQVSPQIAGQAQAIALELAESLELVGTLAVEFFVDRSGRLLFNEMAPRPHNSGHWTLSGCTVSQFEQHVRAVADWPLREPRVLAPTCMDNLLGAEVLEPQLWGQEGALQVYGKAEAKPGRKMGHINRFEDKAHGV